VVVLLFALIFIFLPDVKIQWRDVWIGALMAAIFVAIGAALLAAPPPTEGAGNGRQSALEFIRNFFAPAPPPQMVMGEKICVPAAGPGGNQPAPQNPE